MKSAEARPVLTDEFEPGACGDCNDNGVVSIDELVSIIATSLAH